jgi:peptide/nickel transport system ATP-binding protein
MQPFINIDLGGPAQPLLKVNHLLKYFRAGGAKAGKWCRRWTTSALR